MSERTYTEDQYIAVANLYARYRDVLSLIQELCDDSGGRIVREQIIEALLEDEKRDCVPSAWQQYLPGKDGSDPQNCNRCFACIGNQRVRAGSFLTVGMTRMIACAQCRNKRCPHATNHHFDCTGSNEPGQEGSRYVATPPASSAVPVARGAENEGGGDRG